MANQIRGWSTDDLDDLSSSLDGKGATKQRARMARRVEGQAQAENPLGFNVSVPVREENSHAVAAAAVASADLSGGSLPHVLYNNDAKVGQSLTKIWQMALEGGGQASNSGHAKTVASLSRKKFNLFKRVVETASALLPPNWFKKHGEHDFTLAEKTPDMKFRHRLDGKEFAGDLSYEQFGEYWFELAKLYKAVDTIEDYAEFTGRLQLSMESVKWPMAPKPRDYPGIVLASDEKSAGNIMGSPPEALVATKAISSKGINSNIIDDSYSSKNSGSNVEAAAADNNDNAEEKREASADGDDGRGRRPSASLMEVRISRPNSRSSNPPSSPSQFRTSRPNTGASDMATIPYSLGAATMSPPAPPKLLKGSSESTKVLESPGIENPANFTLSVEGANAMTHDGDAESFSHKLSTGNLQPYANPEQRRSTIGNVMNARVMEGRVWPPPEIKLKASVERIVRGEPNRDPISCISYDTISQLSLSSAAHRSVGLIASSSDGDIILGTPASGNGARHSDDATAQQQQQQQQLRQNQNQSIASGSGSLDTYSFNFAAIAPKNEEEMIKELQESIRKGAKHNIKKTAKFEAAR